jgi:DNA-binding transcriptional ArsR family regulator
MRWRWQGLERSADVEERKEKPKNAAAGEAQGEQKLSLEQRLHRALSHPLRVQILDRLNVGEWSPRELERELGEGLSQVSYHVKVLRDFELIEMTKTEPRRGAVEHFYRAVVRPHAPAGMAKDMPKSAQRIVGNHILQRIDDDVAASLQSGKFYARDDWHTSWSPADLDSQACREAERLVDRFIASYLKLEAESANRRASGENEGEHVWTSLAILIFGSELGEKDSGPLRQKKRRRVKKRSS